MLPRPGDAVELARRGVVAEAVDLVVVGPQLAGHRMEIHADRIAMADRVDLLLAAVLVHADDAADPGLLVQLHLLLGLHVVRLAQLDVDFLVRADPAHPRGVVEALLLLRDQLALLHHLADRDVRALIEELGGRNTRMRLRSAI